MNGNRLLLDQWSAGCCPSPYNPADPRDLAGQPAGEGSFGLAVMIAIS